MDNNLKIKRTYTGFSGIINTGKYSFFVILDNYGGDILTEQLALSCINYNNIIIKSVKNQEVFEQCDELVKLISKIEKKNSKSVIEIHTMGTIRPKGIKKINNINFIVNIQLKNSGINYKDRINDKAIKWFIDTDSNFIFHINNNNDFDEMCLIINEFGIPKSKVYLIPKINEDDDENKIFNNVKEIAESKSFNISLNFDKILWS
jgi:hypothetical protein